MSDNSLKLFRPSKPLMIWDGECNFCRMCAERFSSYKEKKVDLLPYQKLHEKYPHAPKKDYTSSVVLFMPTGVVYHAAAAIYRFFAEYPRKGWAFKAYQRFRWFATLSEWGYQFVANHRSFFRKLVNLFWGKNFLFSTYRISGWFFGRLLGFTILVSYLSLWTQASGLIGPEGIMPFQENLNQVRNNSISEISQTVFFIRPTLLWFISGINGLTFLFILGILSATLLIFGIIPHIAVLISWISYLSITVVSQPFLNFQWDLLLLETMLLSFFFLPWVVREKISFLGDPHFIGRLLLWLLLLKLMFESGLVKFTYFGTNGSNTWIDFTALDYHYWTQPIPSWLSWYFHWLPNWFDKISLMITFFVELVLPFFIVFPRRFRNISSLGIVFLQIMIIITGNYGFFNLLTIVLCLTLVDDQTIHKKLKSYFFYAHFNYPNVFRRFYIKTILGLIVLVMFIITGSIYLRLDIGGNRTNFVDESISSSPIKNTLLRVAQSTRSMNSYGLFRVMTTARPEINISYSDDGKNWKPYIFKYKPVELKTPPRFFFPHMPRLDWQMWFEALYIEQIMKTKFSLFLYKRFLEVVAKGDMKIDELKIEQFFSIYELQEINSMNVMERQQVIRNFQMHINRYFDHSYWFVSFLRALRQSNPHVLDLLSENNIHKQPKNMRISLDYYNFSNPEQKKNGYWWNKEYEKQFSLDINFEDN